MLHIGEKIREVVQNQGVSITDLAKKIDTTRENMYGIFKRKSIDTDLLKKISEVLNVDFFNYYIDKRESDAIIESLNKAIEAKDAEIQYLKKINFLLEEKETYTKKPKKE